MDRTDVIRFAICLTYFHIGGLATTNIERLCKGSNLSVTDSRCFCPVCKKKINWFLQLPIISYVVCRGKCINCSNKIPVKSLMLEIAVFGIMTAISAVFDFSPEGVLASYGSYELIKLIYIRINGKRDKAFAKEYVISVLLISFFLVVTEFMALILLYIK